MARIKNGMGRIESMDLKDLKGHVWHKEWNAQGMEWVAVRHKGLKAWV
jgi:hypothetical protein